jgi:DNA-binding CsgD family transcriptional regulator
MRLVEESQDPQALRRCLRDLVALSTLPAMWRDYDPPQIAESVAGALLAMLSADFVHVTFPAGLSQKLAETTLVGCSARKRCVGKIRNALRGALPGHAAERILSLPNLIGKGTMRIAVAPIGISDDAAIAAGSRDLDFPSEIQRLLLAIASTDATVALHRWHAAFASADRSTEVEDAARRIATLSPREREVLDALVAGQSNKGIAFELGLSVRTVEVHRARMMDRLGARHLAEAVRLAVIARLASRFDT